MRKLFFFCAFSIIAVISNAQDKIITVNKDTIECRIVSIGSEQISYVQKSSNGYMQGKFIPINQVASYSYFPESKKAKAFRQKPERPWLFRFNAGGSWMPWLLDDVEDMSNNEKKLAKGFHLNASGYYLFTNFLGVGIQYSFFQSKANNEYSFFTGSYSPPIYAMATEKEKQYINYIGPSIIFQQFLDKNKKIQLSERLSTGAIYYRVESQVFTEIPSSSVYTQYTTNALIEGQTFGGTFGLSVEYYISPALSIGIGGDFLFGMLKKVDIKQNSESSYQSKSDVELDNKLKISRVDYFLGLSFHF